MNSRERVLNAIDHIEPDRVPNNIWMFRKDTKEKVVARYGSMEKFFDRFNIDVHMEITPPPCATNPDYIEEKMNLDIYRNTGLIRTIPGSIKALRILRSNMERIRQYLFMFGEQLNRSMGFQV